MVLLCLAPGAPVWGGVMHRIPTTVPSEHVLNQGLNVDRTGYRDGAVVAPGCPRRGGVTCRRPKHAPVSTFLTIYSMMTGRGLGMRFSGTSFSRN